MKGYKRIVTSGLALFIMAGCSSLEVDVGDEAAAELPDLNGLWQAVGTAHWNLEGGHAIKGPATIVMGALGGIPAGKSYVVGGAIPYTCLLYTSDAADE